MFTGQFLSEIETAFGEKMSLCKNEEILKKINKILLDEKEDVCQAFCYLYAAMPLSDMQDYDPEVFLEFARHGAFLYKTYGKEKKIPERIFAEYSINHRVNNEDIVPHRRYFHTELASYTRGKSMEEAVIDINFWCGSKVTYRASDERTANPMTVYRTGLGRCGEESTFVVSVLRSLGIPARQVYVPLWSHCDDNHAWVEAWCDGEWKFFGACEPEGVLDHGWFFNASQRAMMVRSKSFLLAEKDLEHRKISEAYEVTQTRRYAPTKIIDVTLKFPQKIQKEGIEVHFQVLNYSYFDDIAVAKTDKDGKLSLTIGLGSLLVTAFYEGYYGEMVIDTQTESSFVLDMKESKGSKQVQKFVIKAPSISKETAKKPPLLNGEKASYYAKRLEEVTDSRLKREAGFFDEKRASEALLEFTKEEAEKLVEILKKSRGNFEELVTFLSYKDLDKEYKYQILLSLSDKDYLDSKAEVLREHCLYTEKNEKYPMEIWADYVLNPRVGYERIKAYRKTLRELYKRRNIVSIKEVRRLWKELNALISTRAGGLYGGLLLTGYEAILGSYASMKSKQILMVQVLRSLGFASRLHPIEGFVEVYMDGVFIAVEELNKKPMDKKLFITFEKEITWQYLSNWSISKFIGGRYQVLENLSVDIKDSKAGIELSSGDYKLVTENRLPNGNIFASQRVFSLEDKDSESIEVFEYKAEATDMLGNNFLTDFALKKGEEPLMLKSLSKDSPAIVVWLEEKKEPTEHILNELWERREKIKDLGLLWYFVVRNEEALKDANISRALSAGFPITVLKDSFYGGVEKLARELYTEPGLYPLLLMMDETATGLYGVAGYNVGTVDMVIKLGEYLHTKMSDKRS